MNYNEIEELRIDETIWVIFIFLSILNITGDECQKDYCINKSKKSEELSKNIFLLTVFASFIIYSYISYKKYKRVQYNKENNIDNTLAKRRLLASSLVVVASLIYLSCQARECAASNPSIL